MRHIVLVTGSRRANNKHSKLIRSRLDIHHCTAIENGDEFWLVHGGCRGADELSENISRDIVDTAVSFQAPWERHGKSAGHRRNATMIAFLKEQRALEHKVHCEAFPLGESAGTRGCARLARTANIWTFVTELDA